MEFLILALIFLLFARIGYYLGKTKNRAREAVLISLILGPLGWILILLMPAEPPAGSARRLLDL